MAWPGLLALSLAVTSYGFNHGHPIIFFNIAYLVLAVSLFMLEIYMPHEREWLVQKDGQTFANIAHTLTSKGTVQTLLIFAGVIGLAELITPVAEPGYSIWPRQWPMTVQVIIGLIVAEFPLYWAHRLGHEFPFLWRFHAVHHSVTKLWIINTGRFHFMDSLIKIVVGMAVLLALGAPIEVVQWLSAVTAFIGILTHCNVEMRFGPLSLIFNTPELHRWHHSQDLREGNMNYCENVMIWDHLFGTYFRDEPRRPPVNIGIPEFMPPRFVHQLAWPFLNKDRRAQIEAGYKS